MQRNEESACINSQCQCDLWSECFHVIKPLPLQEGETLSSPGVRQGAVLNGVENETLQQPEVRRLARHPHEGLVEVIAQALGLPGAHVIAGQNHGKSFLNQGRSRMIPQITD